MKKILLFSLLILPCMAMSQSKSNDALPYTATFSSQFTVDDAKYTTKVLSLWKDFEENKFGRNDNLFADTVTVVRFDGEVVKGKENVFAKRSLYRNSIKNLKSSVIAYVGLKSVDKDKHIVSIWGTRDFADKDGKNVKQHVHEVWVFNKDDKVDFMTQFVKK